MNHTAFYVIISRVRTSNSIRLLYKDNQGLNRLRLQKPDPYLQAWNSGYVDGIWTANACVTVFEKLSINKPKAKSSTLRTTGKTTDIVDICPAKPPTTDGAVGLVLPTVDCVSKPLDRTVSTHDSHSASVSSASTSRTGGQSLS